MLDHLLPTCYAIHYTIISVIHFPVTLHYSVSRYYYLTLYYSIHYSIHVLCHSLQRLLWHPLQLCYVINLIVVFDSCIMSVVTLSIIAMLSNIIHCTFTSCNSLHSSITSLQLYFFIHCTVTLHYLLLHYITYPSSHSQLCIVVGERVVAIVSITQFVKLLLIILDLE